MLVDFASKHRLSKDTSRQQDYANRWLGLAADTRNTVKNNALVTLGSASPKAGAVAAQVVSAIAAVELPAAQWMEVVEVLLRFMDNAENTNLRIATLQAIGFICETIVSHSLRIPVIPF